MLSGLRNAGDFDIIDVYGDNRCSLCISFLLSGESLRVYGSGGFAFGGEEC